MSVEVREETIGRSLTLTSTAQWDAVGEIRSARSGIATTVDVLNGFIDQGDRLLTVDLQPITVVRGSVPAFRDMHEGVEGQDIQQLESFLAAAGFNPGRRDGRFDKHTASAVSAWQRSSGQVQTGTVPLGAVTFIPTTPARVRILAAVGNSLAPGDVLAEVLGDAPRFEVPVTEEQAALIPPSAPVTLQADNAVWQARAGELVRAEDGGQRLRLLAVDGVGVCADRCGAVSVDRTSTWAAAIALVPEVTGPTLPAAAIRTDANGRRFVLTEDGEEIDVTVGVSADGLAAVTGVAPGTAVVLPERPS